MHVTILKLFCDSDRIQTYDSQLRRLLLYSLSYRAIIVGIPRIELKIRGPKSLVLPLHHTPISNG